MTVASRYITVPERELHYTEWGRGNVETVVMWHGLARKNARRDSSRYV